MKRTIALTLLVALLAAALSGCAGTNYGYGGEYRGNVSTTDNGYVNGTNQDTGYANGTNGTANGGNYNGVNGTQGTTRGNGSGYVNGNSAGTGTGTGRATPNAGTGQSAR